jgi:hypothetical protein
MAPRAGFEVNRKYVMRKDDGSGMPADTPSSTPRPEADVRGFDMRTFGGLEWSMGSAMRRSGRCARSSSAVIADDAG